MDEYRKLGMKARRGSKGRTVRLIQHPDDGSSKNL
jgi:hypothetical protein